MPNITNTDRWLSLLLCVEGRGHELWFLAGGFPVQRDAGYAWLLPHAPAAFLSLAVALSTDLC